MASFDEAILPGQAGKVTASIRTDGYSGPISKTIAVRTNDPAHPSVTLTLRATVVASVNFYPGRNLVLSVGRSDENVVRTLVRKDESETGTLEISEIASTVPWLSATARKIGEAGAVEPGLPPAEPGDWLIEARLVGDAPPSPSSVGVRFKTGLAREPEAAVWVSVRTMPALAVSAPSIVLDAPQPGQPASGSTILTVRWDLDPTALRVTAEPTPFSVRTSPLGPRSFRLEITWTEGEAGASPRQGRVTVILGSERATVFVRVLPPSLPRPASAAGPAPAL